MPCSRNECLKLGFLVSLDFKKVLIVQQHSMEIKGNENLHQF